MQCSDDTRKKTVAGQLFLVVLGLGLIKLLPLATPSLNPHKLAGPARGDIHVEDECLAESVGSWKKVAFIDAPLVKDLPTGGTHVPWIHSWEFKKGAANALVSFDQAGFYDWHELSYCYSSAGWNLEERNVRSADDEWPYVVCRLTKPSGVHALLVFSLFYEDGSFVIPPEYSTKRAVVDETIGEIIRRKVTRQHLPKSSSQSQVLVVTSYELDEKMEQAVINLHQGTRRAFRDCWLQHKATRID